jgi:hypothetical protein
VAAAPPQFPTPPPETKPTGTDQERFDAARKTLNGLGVPVIDPTPGTITPRELKAIESAAASFEVMRDTGMQLPDEFTFEHAGSRGGIAYAQAGLGKGSVLMVANLDDNWWDDPVAAGKGKGPDGDRWFTVEDPRGIFIHEALHNDFYLRAGDDGWLKNHYLTQVPGGGSYTQAARAAYENDPGVSEYATGGSGYKPGEFIAEIGTGLIMGKSYQPATMDLFNAIGGQHYIPGSVTRQVEEPAPTLFFRNTF